MNVKGCLLDGGKRRLHHGWMTQAERLAIARDAAKMTQQQVADHFNIRPQSVSQWESAGTSPSRTKLVELARLYDVRLEWLLKEQGSMRAGGDQPKDVAWVRELDVRAAAGLNASAVEIMKGDEDGATIGMHAFPSAGFAQAYGSAARRVRIINAIGDSMAPTILPGERLMVDIGDNAPSPPGIFVIWDGLGIVVKRIEFVPHSDPPTVRLSSDNAHYEPYERTVGEAHILGRVIGKWWRM